MTRPGETLPCPNCAGEGVVTTPPWPDSEGVITTEVQCPMCDGHGEYDPTEWRYQ